MDSPTHRDAPASGGARSRGHSVGPAIVVVASLAVLLLLVVLGSVLEIGERLGRVHPVLAVLLYVAIAGVLVGGVAVPVIKVVSQPVFSLYRLRDERGRSRRWWCRRLVAGLEQNGNLSDQDLVRLRSCLEAGDNADDELISFFTTTVVPTMDVRIKQAARTTFCATAISQSPLVDAATVLSVSFNLVRSLVDSCGFRPSNLALARLYARVMGSALVAGGLEDMDLETLLAGVLGGGASGKLSGVVVASTAQGLVNAFLVFRVGCMTKGYLCAEDGPANMADLRRTSYKEALCLMKSTGFVQEMLRIVKERMAAVAEDVVSGVKDVASEAATSVGRAVRNNPLVRVFTKTSAKETGLETSSQDPVSPA